METLEQDLETMTALVPLLMGAFQRRLARDLSGFGLTVSQFVTLNALEDYEGECRMGPLAAAALQSAASMTGIVDRLLERGLVERQRHPEDRRSVVVQLTDKGRALLCEVKEHRRQHWRALFGQFSLEDRRRMQAVLRAMIERLGEDGE